MLELSRALPKLYLAQMFRTVLLLVLVVPFVLEAEGHHLMWSDEFNGAAGARPDASKWSYETGDHFPNDELETYTDSIENVYQDGRGHLVIRATKQGDRYTSGRIRTRGKFTVEYGRIEARIKIPWGQGIWPAFWMMGDENGKPWPDCGEIDIMENIGKVEDMPLVHGTVHGPGYSGKDGITHVYKTPDGKPLADRFRVYAVDWRPNRIAFYLDDHEYAEVTPASLPAGAHWVYDHPFYLLLNVAVGGNWPGSPGGTTVFPQKMLVDWVRVYK